MDVRCERCRAQYTFEESQVPGAGLTVQCTACGHVFRVARKELVVTLPVRPEDLGEAPTPATAVAAQRPLPSAEPPNPWTIRQQGGQTLSFSELSTLQRWIVERKVTRGDEVTQGDGVWVRLGTLAELQTFFEVVEAAHRGEGRTTARYPAATSPAPEAVQPPAATPTTPAPVAAPAPPVQPQAELDQADLAAVGRASRTRTTVLVVLLLLVAAAALAYVFMPALFGRSPPPRPPAPPIAAVVPEPTPPPQPPPPEPKPAEPAAAPEPAAVKAPEPVPVPVPEPKPRAEPKARGKPARPPSLRQQVAEAQRLREGGKAEQALDLYGRILAQEPENADALAGRGLSYLDLDQPAAAEASLQEALRRAPRQPDALLGLGELYRARGRKAEAIALFERYLAAHPQGDEAAVARNALNQLKEGP
jgi:predicted Zn finger-like uncharacterized protein